MPNDSCGENFYSRDYLRALLYRSCNVHFSPAVSGSRIQALQAFFSTIIDNISSKSYSPAYWQSASGVYPEGVDVSVRFFQDDPWSKDDNCASRYRDYTTEHQCDQGAAHVIEGSAIKSPIGRAIQKP